MASAVIFAAGKDKDARRGRHGDESRGGDETLLLLACKCAGVSERTWTVQMRRIGSDQKLLDVARGDGGNGNTEMRRGLG